MICVQLSFDGLEVTPDLSVAASSNVRGNKKKRPHSQVADQSASASSAAAAAGSSPAAASSAAPNLLDRMINGGGKRAKPDSNSGSSKKKKGGVPSFGAAAAAAGHSASSKAERKMKSEYKERLAKYAAVQGDLHGKAAIKAVKNSALKKEMRLSDKAKVQHAAAAARAEILLPSSAGSLEVSSDSGDRTWRIRQEQLKPQVDVRTQAKMFDLGLTEFGPYTCKYTRNGRHLLLAGRKGHLNLMDWKSFALTSELHVKEQVNDACFLHDESMYAVAQKKYVYIYDRTGMELHALRNHFDVNRLEFLPYHFLLASVGATGYLKYQDTSTGAFVAEHRTKLGACEVMRQNPANAVMLLGHNNGTVTMWTPNMPQPVATILTHRAPLLALAVDPAGHMLATSGLDGQVKVWDVRTYKELHSYFTVRPAQSIDISQSGMMALGFGPHVQVWKDAFKEKQNAPYMVKQLPGQVVRNVSFCPFEDVLGVGHSGGFSSLVIPGAGEANFDSFAANPFATRAQTRESTVHSLLDKLQPDMITLDSNMFGLMDRKGKAAFDGSRAVVRQQKMQEATDKSMEANKARGKSKSSKKVNRKRANIVDQARMERVEKAQKVQQQIVQRKEAQQREADGKPKSALQRFG